MVKQRMATADVAGEVACLRQRVLGMRVANVYDLNSKTYMLKLAKSGEDGEKAFLVLESGSRFHTTQYQKEKSDTPSNFTLKLRKHLRTRRLEDIKQLGVDRIVDFQFGSGDARYHLILELYSQ
ncbi:MAG: nuclear export mediator factor NEMF-like isoform X1, partial [Trebouxia sp. A1-2]